MSVGNYNRRDASAERKEKDDRDISWSSPDAPSPTDSSEDYDSDPTANDEVSSSSSTLHSPPSPSSSKLSSPIKTHPYRTAAPIPARPIRPRGLGLTPLSASTAPNGLPLGTGALPKAQPLSRTLFARKANDVPHAGMSAGGKKKGGNQTKVIVPTKGFRTTFELGLTASELARK